MTQEPVPDVESQMRELDRELTEPRAHECLFCYVYRMVDLDGCRGLAWACRYRDLKAPRATRLERRLGAAGGYCDCEIFLNTAEPDPAAWPARHLAAAEPAVRDRRGYTEEIAYPGETGEWPDDDEEDPEPPDAWQLVDLDNPPPCRGVRAGSTQACALWHALRDYGSTYSFRYGPRAPYW
jgi:hypothetical protein